MATSPEIDYHLAKATRTDYIWLLGDQIIPIMNNVLGFPCYSLRGALDVRATKINEAMKWLRLERLQL
jgi:malate dehydrogenase (oxaloacetate-decarboxylating)(NADP+)